MQTQVTQERCNGLGRMPGISLIVPGAAAILLTWGPSSIGGTSSISAPAVLPPMQVPAYSAYEVADPARASLSTNGPGCGRASVQEMDGRSGVDLWCVTDIDLVDEMAADDQSKSQRWADVATFLEWHVQARNLAQYDYQVPLTALLRPRAKAAGPSAVPVAAPLWTTFSHAR
jgi:hypothetical protein